MTSDRRWRDRRSHLGAALSASCACCVEAEIMRPAIDGTLGRLLASQLGVIIHAPRACFSKPISIRVGRGRRPLARRRGACSTKNRRESRTGRRPSRLRRSGPPRPRRARPMVPAPRAMDGRGSAGCAISRSRLPSACLRRCGAVADRSGPIRRCWWRGVRARLVPPSPAWG